MKLEEKIFNFRIVKAFLREVYWKRLIYVTSETIKYIKHHMKVKFFFLIMDKNRMRPFWKQDHCRYS